MAETCRAPSMSPASAVTSDFLGESGTRNVTAVSELVREPQGLGCAAGLRLLRAGALPTPGESPCADPAVCGVPCDY